MHFDEIAFSMQKFNNFHYSEFPLICSAHGANKISSESYRDQILIKYSSHVFRGGEIAMLLSAALSFVPWIFQKCY